MAYRAEIEIGVKGVRSLEQLRSEVNKTATAVESLNSVVNQRGGLVQSIQNYTDQLDKSARSLASVGAGTRAETKAINEYVTALGQANTARARQNALIDAEIKRRSEVARIQRLTAAGIYETTRFKQPIGPAPSPLQGQSSPVAERIARTIAQRSEEKALQDALLRLEQRKADELNKQLQLKGQLNAATAKEVQLLRSGIRPSTQYTQAIGPALPPATKRRVAGPAATLGGGRLGGIVSNAVIGGAFPLLFGQGGAAATGGALGGLVGGAFGGAGGFAGSLLGTLLGQIAGQANQVKELAADIGFSAQQTQLLGTAFKQAGADFDKFAESVSRIQGLGLALEDQAKAIQLASTLTEVYGGKIDKVTNAFTNALQNGKVTQATLNQLTSQGIPIQEALANKYKVSRDVLLEMAKDGKISVQDLINTLVDLGNKGSEAAQKPKSAMDRLSESTRNLTQALSGLVRSVVNTFGPAFEWLTNRVTDFVNAVARAIARLGDLQTAGRMNQVSISASAAAQRATTQKFGPLGGIRAFNPAAEKFYQQEYQRQVRAAAPGAVARPRTRTRLETFAAPAQLAPSGGSKGRTKTSAAERAAQQALELAALLTQLREQLRIETKSLELQQAISFARADGNEKLVAFLQTQEKFYNIDEKASKLREDFDAGKIKNAEFTLRQQLLEIERKKVEITEEERLNAVLRERYQITAEILDAARRARENAFGQGLGGAGTFRTDINLMPGLTGGAIGTRYEELRLELKELTKLSTQVIEAAQGIGDAFGSSFKGMITGAMSAQDALANFFNSLADYFADMASRMIAKWLEMQIIGLAQSLLPGSSLLFPQGVGNFSSAFGAGGPSFNQSFAFGGFRAAGGSVRGSTPYIVGERGPELFVPGSGGSIVPNNQLGGMGGDVSVVVNVDATGSSVQGDDNQAKALGAVVGVAVRAEIVKQQRPGGLLAGTR